MPMQRMVWLLHRALRSAFVAACLSCLLSRLTCLACFPALHPSGWWSLAKRPLTAPVFTNIPNPQQRWWLNVVY